MSDCIFCRIVAREIPSKRLIDNDEVIAINDINPVAEVHVLIIPKKHIRTFKDIKELDKDTLMMMTDVAQKMIEKTKTQSGYKMVFNGGKYQEVPHLHWHLLGGKMKDDRKE